jgi:restriction system protein
LLGDCKEEKDKKNKRILRWLFYTMILILALSFPSFGFFCIGLWGTYKFVKFVKWCDQNERYTDIPAPPTFKEIDIMSGFEFEKYMKEVYENLGYSVHHTPLSGDQGADLILTSNEGIRTAVQVKRYSNNVSNGAIQEVVAAKGFYKCTRGMVVTNSNFTDSAIQLAKANDIKLVDRTSLKNVLKESYQLTCEKHKSARK